MKKQLPGWVVLGVIAITAGLLLALTNELTADKVAQQQKAKSEEARNKLLSEADSFEEIPATDGIDVAYVGKKNGEIVGYVAQVTVSGYSGKIEVLTGMDLTGKLTGISVGGAEFSETVGLGSKTKEPAFTDQFIGLTLPAKLKDNVDSVTGASISSGAVVNAVNTAGEFLSGLIK